ncbi:MAG TPA: EF-P beta-lysylation protein EpmB [Steroidobacteraceae bacterium]|nr:EF-P beta-lysylation protein EpmB [Steroidobacteraceae bacterium]
MIPASPIRDQRAEPPRWQRLLAEAITDPGELIRLLGLDPGLAERAVAAARLFPLRVPRGFVARMRPGDPDDPLLRQVLPLDAELLDEPGSVEDPVGDLASAPAPGILQKYAGRALLVTTGACAVNCRYCFRRHFPYAEENAAAAQWRGTIEWLQGHSDVTELILSGGDPLSLSDRRLAALTDPLPGMTSVRRLRVHTRLPVVLPERVDAGLLKWIESLRMPLVVVLHVNHAREIDAAVADAIRAMLERGVRLYNQSVLLRGVNDSAAVLAELSEALFDAGVVPYYLHLLDRVAGAVHFDVSEDRACALWAELAARLPGYLVPRLTREVPGAPAKVPVPVALR